MIKHSLRLILFSVGILMTIVSCDRTKQYEEDERRQIDEYLERNSTLNFELKPSGLYYLEIVKGTGRMPVKFDTAFVKYTGKFLDGVIFDSNVSETSYLEVLVGAPGLIPGFAEGINYMAAGGKSLLLVPSSLGYGTTGSYYGGISGYTPLLFEVDLVQVRAGPGK